MDAVQDHRHDAEHGRFADRPSEIPPRGLWDVVWRVYSDILNDRVTLIAAGATYYIVVEAYGTEHLDVASGPCTDDGTSTGTVFDPTYTLSFDVSQSTGCAEDCDDGLDDDLDDLVDCDDDDCFREPLCCDLDGDGSFALDCDGDDCDDNDASVYPGAPELADGQDVRIQEEDRSRRTRGSGSGTSSGSDSR